jgi:hypothetical protein
MGVLRDERNFVNTHWRRPHKHAVDSYQDLAEDAKDHRYYILYIH